MIVNVTRDEGTILVGDGADTWEIAAPGGERRPFDADRSLALTSDPIGGELEMSLGGERTMKHAYR